MKQASHRVSRCALKRLYASQPRSPPSGWVAPHPHDLCVDENDERRGREAKTGKRDMAHLEMMLYLMFMAPRSPPAFQG